MKVSRSVWALLAVIVLAGCPESDEETEETEAKKDDKTEAKESGEASAKPVATIVPEDGPDPSVTARAKAELDGKAATGSGGSTLSVSGTKVSFSTPNDWKSGKSGDFQTSTAGDEKARFAAADAKSDALGKRDAAAGALSLTECKWGATESITMGASKRSTNVADGLCKRGATEVPVVWADFEGVVAVGGWDKGGGSDQKLFDVFRSAKAATGGGGDPTGIAACCSALRQNANSAPLNQKGSYLAAAAACDAVRKSPQGRAALAGARSMVRSSGGNVPTSCL